MPFFWAGAVAVELPDLELAALQTDSTTVAAIALQTEPVTVASATTLNGSETVATALTPTRLEDVASSDQESASPTLDLTNVPVVPATFTTTGERVEPLAADTTSSDPEFSPPTEVFPPALEPGQNVESGTVEPMTTTESSDHLFVAPEPHSRHSFVEPQNSDPELTNGAVHHAAIVLEVPVNLDQTAHVSAPLSSDPESQPSTIELRAELETANESVAEHAMNGSAEQALKTAETLEQSAVFIKGANAVGVLGSNYTTVPESSPERPLAEPIVETAPLAAEQGAVTPTTPLPEPLPPVDRVQELATFAAALFGTWQRLTLAKRGELSLCWGLGVSFDHLFREGFTHMTAYRFFVLLEALLQSETDYAYGCLQVSHGGKTEPVTLKGQPFNRLTFYAPGTPKQAQNQTALKQAQGKVALQPTESSEQELARIRQERQEHLASVEQDKVQQNGRQSKHKHRDRVVY